MPHTDCVTRCSRAHIIGEASPSFVSNNRLVITLDTEIRALVCSRLSWSRSAISELQNGPSNPHPEAQTYTSQIYVRWADYSFLEDPCKNSKWYNIVLWAWSTMLYQSPFNSCYMWLQERESLTRRSEQCKRSEYENWKRYAVLPSCTIPNPRQSQAKAENSIFVQFSAVGRIKLVK